jgi:hypothetical protein
MEVIPQETISEQIGNRNKVPLEQSQKQIAPLDSSVSEQVTLIYGLKCKFEARYLCGTM